VNVQRVELISAPIGEVGRCAIGCGRPAALMFTARMPGYSSSTFSCHDHRADGEARALRMLADMLERDAVERRRRRSSRLAAERLAHV
jgi:hypothetical protein